MAFVFTRHGPSSLAYYLNNYEDESLEIRKSHENPHVLKIYQEFFTEGPCGEKSHHLLHTHYINRGRAIV